MSYPTNTLQAVQTYQKSGLAYLQNQYAGIATANTKFKDFQNFTGQLGSTVTFDRPSRFLAVPGLVANGNWQAAAQLVQSLSCNQSSNIPFAFTNQEYLFNAEPYVPMFTESAIAELGSFIESNIMGVAESNTYRTYGSFTIAGGASTMDEINSFGQLAKSLTNYQDFGCPKGMVKYYLPLTAESDIVNSGLNQFAIDRNNEMAMDWMVGKFGIADFYSSNLLPIHTAGTIGNTGADITVVMIDVTGTQITATTTIGGTFKAGDILQFSDGVSGQPNMRFLTYVGHKACAQKVQVRVTEDATADGAGGVVLKIFPALISDAADANKNINNPVASGMKLKAFPDHRCGYVVGGDARYLAMPRLPDQDPFKTANDYDDESACSIRVTSGTVFGQNERGIIADAIWGTTMVDDYAMRVAFPV